MYIRLEGQTGVPLYMTEPAGPSWFVRFNSGTTVEIRVENGRPWIREANHQQWRGGEEQC